MPTSRVIAFVVKEFTEALPAMVLFAMGFMSSVLTLRPVGRRQR